MKIDTRNMSVPLVSVIILNYRRREALERCVDSVLQQEYVRREIIVVDNHSQGDLKDFLQARDSTIRLVELQENRGACGGRNAGIREARGEILITLDNDMIFASPFELTKVVRTFQERPEIHVLAFQVCDAETGETRLREWCHPKNWQEFAQAEFETNFFVEGACATRRSAFEAAGLYYEPLFIGCEGHDLALRFLDRQFRILYCPSARVFHLMSAETRTSERPFYFYTRNYIWIAYKDYRFLAGMRFLVPKLAMMLYFTLRSGCSRAFLSGIWDGLKGLQRIRKERTPMRAATVKYLTEMEKDRPSLLFRFARHRTQPQL